MNLLLSLRSEIVKTKRTAAVYFTLAGAAVVPLIFLLNVQSEGLPGGGKSGRSPLDAVFRLCAEMTGMGIFPLFVVLACTLLPQTEHRNNTWKQVLASPQTKTNVFLSKFLNLQLLLIVFLVANHLFIWLAVVATHFILPDSDILNQPFDGYAALLNAVHSYTTLLAVCALQFWMGLGFKNFIVPVAIGVVLWLFGTVSVLEYHWAFAVYFPYSFQVFGFSTAYKPQLPQVEWTSLGYAAIVLAAAFLDFRRRRMVG